MNIVTLVDDALNMRRVSSNSSFVSNRAASDLLEQKHLAFAEIDRRLRKDSKEDLLNMRGISAVLGIYFVLGNRHAPQELCNALESLPIELVKVAVGQGAYALGRDPVHELIWRLIERFRTREENGLRDCAIRFKRQIDMHPRTKHWSYWSESERIEPQANQ